MYTDRGRSVLQDKLQSQNVRAHGVGAGGRVCRYETRVHN